MYYIAFYNQIIFHCMDRTHFVYLVISWWTFGLFPLFDYYDYYFLTILLLWTLVYKFLYKHMFSVLLGIYLGVGLLSHVITLCLTLEVPCFPKCYTIWHSHQQCMRILISPHPQQLFNYSHPSGCNVLSPVFVNSVLLEHSHAHLSFPHCLWLILCHKGRIEQLKKDDVSCKA